MKLLTHVRHKSFSRQQFSFHVSIQVTVSSTLFPIYRNYVFIQFHIFILFVFIYKIKSYSINLFNIVMNKICSRTMKMSHVTRFGRLNNSRRVRLMNHQQPKQMAPKNQRLDTYQKKKTKPIRISNSYRIRYFLRFFSLSLHLLLLSTKYYNINIKSKQLKSKIHKFTPGFKC